ncbi:MAG TPA: hypothetical protein VKH19_10545 [Gemmatimonadaceae bacterium]|nr:hypothetical protein [Gemmatimonadaceae bacterium]
MARNAENYGPLIENGLPTNFVRQLHDAVGKLRARLDSRGRARAGRVGAASRASSRSDAASSRSWTPPSRGFSAQSAKFVEWKHVRGVTVKDASVRASVGGVESLPIAFESSPTYGQPSPIVVQTSSIAAHGSPTAQQPQLTFVETTPTAQQKAA